MDSNISLGKTLLSSVSNKSFEFSEEEFHETETRLNEINRLKSKYGNTIEDIFTYWKEKEERLQPGLIRGILMKKKINKIMLIGIINNDSLYCSSTINGNKIFAIRQKHAAPNTTPTIIIFILNS